MFLNESLHTHLSTFNGLKHRNTAFSKAYICKLFYCTIFIFFINGFCLAQVKNASVLSQVTGIVKDSLDNTPLPDAIIKIYSSTDSNVIASALSNDVGAFSIEGLPDNISLKIVVSYIGYKNFEEKLTLSIKEPNKNFGFIYLNNSQTTLELITVTSKLIAITKNKDTLEFNANAYKLNSTAQTEDLLKILPGITVNDKGVISYNGKIVKQVLVDGKPFFGTDAKVITQNLPKDIVSKIQVYSANIDKKMPIDSVVILNVKLKNGKNFGYFGKLSSSFGTRNTNENEGSFNLFNSRSQASFAIAKNNTNKSVGNISSILANSTFKDNDAIYKSNSGQEGVNNYDAGGLSISHDLSANPSPEKINKLNMSYFIENKSKKLSKTIQNITAINDSIKYLQQMQNEEANKELINTANLSYENSNENGFTSIATSFSNAKMTSNNRENVETFNDNNELLSRNNNVSDKNMTNSVYGFTFSHNHNNPKKRTIFSLYGFNYAFNAQNENTDLKMDIQFLSQQNNADNKAYQRKINNIKNNVSHSIGFNIPMINDLFKGKKRLGIDINFNSNIDVNLSKIDDKVIDKDASIQTDVFNTYLTNVLEKRVTDLKSGFEFRKNFTKNSADKNQSFSIGVTTMGQYYNQNNNAQKEFQNLNRTFEKFMPALNLTYDAHKIGKSFNSYGIYLSNSYSYPTIEQLVQLRDSSNLNYVLGGNTALKEQSSVNCAFNYGYSSDSCENVLSCNFNTNVNFSKNAIVLNTITDELGRTNAAYTNATNGVKNINFIVSLNKLYKIKNSQFIFSFSPTLSLSEQPNVVNNLPNISTGISHAYDTKISYDFKNKLNINFSQKFSYATQKQNEITNQVFKTTNIESNLNCNWQLSDKILINSNASYTKNSFNGTPINNFTIWNAFVSYRFLKGNNASIKFTAFDILKQNTGLINTVTNNNISLATQNILQQYFLLTFAYFPRKFGNGNQENL